MTAEWKLMSNRLISEKSPYLLQHAHNPVNWFPWGNEAFEKAKKEDKPIFLSIGYSTCHWCHVMEKESFEDDEVAGLMNDVFISIKVDREERPDIDGIYMTVCQKMTGSGGWPLNLILTPDKKPFYAATYIPKKSKYGRPGMLELIPEIRELWRAKRHDIEELAEKTILDLRKEKESAGEKPDTDLLHRTYEQLLGMFDEHHGGFGDSPKFPTPHNLLFLLRYWKRTGDNMALRMVEKTLSGMRMGGIYDHAGYGFHRYSVDAGWRVPHFEKMLYDQALIAMVFAEAYQATGKEEYKMTCYEIFTYVLRDMTSPDGGFFSGEDADSEGVEGKFYLWKEDEIRSVLSGEEFELIKTVFNTSPDGNFEESTGKNILYLSSSIPEIASFLKISADKLEMKIEAARKKLFAAREKRIHPGKDDKILTDWNGLMIAALAKGAQIFEEPLFAEASRKAADFILSRMEDKFGRLFHRFREGESAIPAFLDDYAFFILGLIELYETTFEVNYLKKAFELNDILLGHFRDDKNGGFYFTADDADAPLIRKKEIYDGAVPSGNSVAALNLIRLGKITADPDFEKKADEIFRTFSRIVTQAPAAYTMLMSALDLAIGPSCEVVISGNPRENDTKNMLMALRSVFIPEMVVIFLPDGPSQDIINFAGYAKDMKKIDGRATAYVCRSFKCQLPTTDIGQMIGLLKN